MPVDVTIAVDFETGDAKRDSACAVGVVRVEGAAVVHREVWLIRPPRPIASVNFSIHRISDSMVAAAPPFAAVWPKVLAVLAGATRLAAHNAPFDKSVVTACCAAAGLTPPALPWVCTQRLAKDRLPGLESLRLPDVCRRLGVPLARHHEAGADAEACARILIALEGRRDEAGTGDRRGDGLPDRGRPGPGPGPARPGPGGPVGGSPPVGAGPPVGGVSPPVVPAAPAAVAAVLAAARRAAGPGLTPEHIDALRRLAEDAAAGGWGEFLPGWVAAWAAARPVVGNVCRSCGLPTGYRTLSICRPCIAAEGSTHTDGPPCHRT